MNAVTTTPYPPEYAERIRTTQLDAARRELANERDVALIPGRLLGAFLFSLAIGVVLGLIWLPLALLAVFHILAYGVGFTAHLYWLVTRPLRLARLHWTIYQLTRNVR